ncbi:MAG: hypothetical protein VYE68_10025 [Acidobacteriota bacterium]|nr:hypothetical protein [Acidobacteriota bacterium]
MHGGFLRRLRLTDNVVMLCLTMAILVPTQVGAQRLSYSSGQNISPAYEGWERDVDGSRHFLFGYMNRNWEETPTVPIGPDNNIEPGGPDLGQATHFQPRRNRFVFRVPVPDEFEVDDEMVWTLTVNGVTERAYATLRQDYFVDSMVRASENGALGAGTSSPTIRANQRPSLRIEGEMTRTVRVGEPLTLVAVAADDGVPESPRKRFERFDPNLTRRWRPSTRVTVNTETGLRVSWFLYRGENRVNFEPSQVSVWEDTRTGAYSPWAPHFINPDPPDDGTWTTEATFDAPGTYVLRCLAADGALDVSYDVTVIVTE